VLMMIVDEICPDIDNTTPSGQQQQDFSREAFRMQSHINTAIPPRKATPIPVEGGGETWEGARFKARYVECYAGCEEAGGGPFRRRSRMKFVPRT
jgi:hypothetical protein